MHRIIILAASITTDNEGIEGACTADSQFHVGAIFERDYQVWVGFLQSRELDGIRGKRTGLYTYPGQFDNCEATI